ncbi:MAG: transposase [Polyangiales bacterium]
MTRQLRRALPGLPHHVVLRGNNRRKLFSFDYERNNFVRMLATGEPRCDIHALCLMSNHVHLIVTPHGNGDLSRFIKHVSQRYAMKKNSQRRSTGKLFEQRFWSKAITNTAYLAVATAYVDDNARSAALTLQDNFAWSTCGLHLGIEGTSASVSKIWTPSYWYLALGGDDNARATRYKEWLDSYRAFEEWLDLKECVPTIDAVTSDRRPNGARVA